MTGDISAFLFDPRQAYSSVRLQQGRVITDLDWNESANIEDARRRDLLRALVCGHGSTDEGFRLVGATLDTVEVAAPGGLAERQTYEVSLASGTFLLGGNLHHWPAGDAQSFLNQDDWLQLTGEDREALPDRPAAARTDLVYLEAFEHPVRAVEDRELRERALGGPDTSTRLKAVRRVRVMTGVTNDCVVASGELRDAVTAPAAGDTSGQPHPFDPVTCEVRSKARLTVDFTGPGPSDDLCKPRVTQGYLGAENQAIRVQLRRANAFLWAYDNGEPFYRVQVTDATPDTDGSIELTFLTQPNDPVLFPMPGMVVEVLPWGCLLANHEKAATRDGHLARITGAYNPGDGTMRIAPEVPSTMQDWLASAERDPMLSPRDEPEPGSLETDTRRYLYVRVWQPGPETGGTLDHPFQPGTPVELPDTGLTVAFSAFGLPGDYWVAAARPNTPDRVVPWRLLEAAAPVGPQRFYAPLGLIDWEVAAGTARVEEIHDCRHRFRKLCDVETCCTVHVGDGNVSNGDTTDLQAAIASLPEAGGRICLLPGRHEASAVIDGRRDIIIHGCGPKSVLVAAPGQQAPILTILESERIALEDLRMESAAPGLVQASDTVDLTLTRIEMEARDRAAVLATAMDGARLRDCSVQTQPLEASTTVGGGAQPAIFLAGSRLAVQRSEVVTELGNLQSRTGLGGIQIGGDSTDVEISDCLIRGGNGAGILLGSVDFQSEEVAGNDDLLRGHYATRRSAPNDAVSIIDSGDNCFRWDPRPRPRNGDGSMRIVPVSDGPVTDVRIRCNRILDMGASGIAVAYWFDPANEADSIVTDRITIEANEIRRCMLIPILGIAPALREILAVGGITLATGRAITVRDNTITDLATSHASPIVGIFVLDGIAVEIQRNHLRDNGQIATLQSPIEIGLAGGIMLAQVRPGVDFFAPFGDQVQARQDGTPACVIEGNTVSSREGRALTVIGVGPMVIHGNRLTAHGSNSLSRIPIVGAIAASFNLNALALIGLLNIRQTQNPLLALLDILGGAAVAVLNLGLSNEVYLQLLGLSGLGVIDAPQQLEAESFDDDIRLLANGNVQFNDNQVVLDSTSPAVTLTLSAILVITLDDVAMQDNQCDCDMAFDFVAVNTLVMGWSTRVQNNRFKEGLLNAFLSCATAALMNNTSHNQGTHCFLTAGAFRPRVTLASGDTAVLETNRHLVPPSFCQPFDANRERFAAGYQLQTTVMLVDQG